jgi:hypothetical protein
MISLIDRPPQVVVFQTAYHTDFADFILVLVSGMGEALGNVRERGDA